MTKKRKNLLLIIVGIIIISIVAYFIYKQTKKEKLPFNKVELVYNNIVYNTTGVDYLDTILHVSLNEMEIYNSVIWIRPMEDFNLRVGGHEADDYEIKATVIQSGENTNHYLLIMDVDESRSFNIMAISHEVIHIKQMDDGRFSALGDSAVFDGTVYYKDILPEYITRPWEQEAYELTPFLTGKVGDILIRKK